MGRLRENFSIADDHFHWVPDFAPTDQHREHKHSDVEAALDEYTPNWEHVETSTFRRGSERLYLVDDTHYVACSRSGMERAGNLIKLTGDVPDALRWTVLSTVFEEVARRKFGTIKAGIDRDALFDDEGLSFATPREFILANECSQSELNAYYDELADMTVDLLSRYHDAATVDDLETIIEWYRDQRTDLFREYAYDDWQPKMAYQALSALDPKNGWRFPSDPGEDDGLYYLMHEYTSDEPENNEFAIDIVENGLIEAGGRIRLFESAGLDEETIHEEATYETVDELVSLLNEYMAITPPNVE